MESAEQDSKPYYDHNAEAYARRTLHDLDRDALERFTRLLQPGARILDAGCGAGRDLKYFRHQGFEARGCDFSSRLAQIASRESGAPVQVTDLRLLSIPRGELDGIWAHRSLVHLPSDGCRRVMAAFFAALKPSGVLFLSMDEGEGTREDRADDRSGPPRVFHLFSPDDIGSLIRQHGFRILETGRGRPPTFGYIARRI